MGGPQMGGPPPPMGAQPFPGAGTSPMPPGGIGGISPGGASQGILQGTPGIYPVAPGRELKVGRDPGLCDICLTEPRISGMHATVKFEAGQVMIRDEGSNNGTFVSGGKIQSYAWVAVPPGSTVRFGPIEFNVRLE